MQSRGFEAAFTGTDFPYTVLVEKYRPFYGSLLILTIMFCWLIPSVLNHWVILMNRLQLTNNLLSIFQKMNEHINKISEELNRIENHKEIDSETILYITKIRRCCILLKQELTVLNENSKSYEQILEIKSDISVFRKIGHALLNPINGIKGYSEIIQEKSKDPFVLASINEIIQIIEDLLNLIYQLIHEKKEGSMKNRILVVEDNEMNRDMLQRRLQRRGYEVTIAVDGQESIQIAENNLPDLIVMDMSLPVMDGWEATRQLKSKAKTQHIPVLALTAHAMLGDKEKSIEAGCDDYDTKPIDFPRLLAKIDKLLGIKKDK